jgi:hypothetical protein
VDQGGLDLDQRVRATAFAFLTEQTQLYGEVLPYAILLTGFTFSGTRVPLINTDQAHQYRPIQCPRLMAPAGEGRGGWNKAVLAADAFGMRW